MLGKYREKKKAWNDSSRTDNFCKWWRSPVLHYTVPISEGYLTIGEEKSRFEINFTDAFW